MAIIYSRIRLAKSNVLAKLKKASTGQQQMSQSRAGCVAVAIDVLRSRIERRRLIAVPRSSSMKYEWKYKRKYKWTRVVCLGLLSLILVPSSASFLLAQNKSQDKVRKQAAPMKLRVGDTAPDFTLLAFDGKELRKVSLRNYRGKKNVALAFFVFAFTGG